VNPGAAAHRVALAVRRRRFLGRLAVACRLSHADIDVHVDPTARIGDGVRVRVAEGVSGALRIGAHTQIGDGVEIRLGGGELRIGDWVEIRRGVAFMVGGVVELVGPNLISWGTVFHCDEHIRLDHHATVGEHVTITDSTHEHRAGSWHLDHVRTAPVDIGTDTWVGAKATITPGVSIGHRCIVAAGAVVTRPVPDDHVAIGVPASVRPRSAGDAG
jgi:acetyltransferase-like isoleucine patch superfamily enzyme